MLILGFLFVAVTGGFIGHSINAGTITDIKAELAKVDATATADVKAFAAKIEAHL